MVLSFRRVSQPPIITGCIRRRNGVSRALRRHAAASPIQRAELVIPVLVILQRNGGGPERVAAARFTNGFLEIEILDRKVVVAAFVWANRCIVCLAHFGRGRLAICVV